MDETTNVTIVIGGVLLFAWLGLAHVGRTTRQRRQVQQALRGAQADAALAAEFRPDPYVIAGGMVECAACGTPFPSGTAFCDCGTPTVEIEEELPDDSPTADTEDLVCIHREDNVWKANLLRGFLETHGIACSIERVMHATSLEIGPQQQWGTIRLMVAPSDADHAQRLIRRLGTKRPV